jgi:Zn-dependent peptidase ImmA (M78 family)
MREQDPTLGDVPSAPVPITADVLDWAVREAGMTTETLAEELDEPRRLVESWRRGEVRPTTGQFRALAKKLHRPETFFFLADPPPEPDVPLSFRSPVTGEGSGKMTAKDVAVVQVAKRVQRISHWLVEEGRRAAPDLQRADTTEPPEDVALRLRAWLGWEERQSRRSGSDARFARWVRTELEGRGLLVLHLSMGKGGWRGFSLHSPAAPVVVANTHFGYRPRVFTYLHELAHLATATESICPPKSTRGNERWCDMVASAVLMPAAEVRQVVTGRLQVRQVTSIDEVRRVANVFMVSLRAAAVRLEHLQLGRSGLYDMIDSVATVNETKRPGGPVGGQARTRPLIRLQDFGRGFVAPLLDAESDHVLTRTDLMDLLNVNVDELRELRSLATAAELTEE